MERIETAAGVQEAADGDNRMMMMTSSAAAVKAKRDSASNHRRPLPEKVNVLLVGGGGREHALAWRIAQSPHRKELWVTERHNAGLTALGRPCEVAVDPKEYWRIINWCDKHAIDLVVVGPDNPLADGICDALQKPGRVVFGVSRAAAQLEADKAWAKQLMRSAAVPTAEARVFSNYEQAVQYLESREDMPVIKASGLAAGKGVILPRTLDEGIEALNQIMKQRIFGASGDQVIIEERLEGPEVSVFALIDGRNLYLLDSCQDHKRLLDHDQGPNTGGMGAYCPTTLITPDILSHIEQEILVPTLDALRREEIEYRGVLYAGLMLTPAGPKVLEFNCRFGDPECQVLMMRLKSDVLEMMWATATGRLDEVELAFDPRPACIIIMSSEGYPGSNIRKGLPITGLEDAAQAQPEVMVFHAGTRVDTDGSTVVTNGGRVLGVTALGETLREARDKALEIVRLIHFEGAHYRTDIGGRVLDDAVQRAPRIGNRPSRGSHHPSAAT